MLPLTDGGRDAVILQPDLVANCGFKVGAQRHSRKRRDVGQRESQAFLRVQGAGRTQAHANDVGRRLIF